MELSHGGVGGGGFVEIAAILSIAALVGILGLQLRQPLIIMLLATGILAGPSCFGVIESYDQIELFAQIGIALLLFIVGLRLDLNLIRTTGAVAVATGIGQVAFTSVIGFGIAVGMGMDFANAGYVAMAITFSSTIIVVKLLSDKREIDSLHGRIAIGLLIVQDIFAIVVMIVLGALGRQDGQNSSTVFLVTKLLLTAVGLLLIVAALMRFVLPAFLRSFAKSQELLVLFAIAWAVFVGAVCDNLGFSKEVGAFLAGISLASTEYRDAIAARLVSLRDFLLLFFFVDLGARLDWTAVGSQVGNAFILSLFVLVGKPLVMLITMGSMGYRRRTSFLAGVTIAQISEFSLIITALGFSLGHINKETMGLVTLVGVITILVSTYMILYSSTLYRWLSTPLKIFERKNAYREAIGERDLSVPKWDVVIAGLGNYGSELAANLIERRRRCIGVDFNPQVLKTWRDKGLEVIYGDMGDPEIHQHLPLNHTRWVVSTVRDASVNLPLCNLLRQGGYEGKIALTATSDEEARMYKTTGAHVVLRPYRDAAEQAADALTEAMHLLPRIIDWPVAFREIRLKAGSVYAGKRILDIPIRSVAGVSILAVSRAGRVYFNPEPTYQLFPGDRLVIMGPSEELQKAERILHQIAEHEDEEDKLTFGVGEVIITENSDWIGKTLADLQLRQKYGVTVIGIHRGDIQLTGPVSTEVFRPGDRLIVIGVAESVAQLKAELPKEALLDPRFS